MIRTRDRFTVILLALLVMAAPAMADRLKDLARVQGVRNNQLVGYGRYRCWGSRPPAR